MSRLAPVICGALANLRIFTLVAATLHTPEAYACGFNEALSGICPSDRFEDRALSSGATDRATIFYTATWRNHPGFKELPEASPIVLEVCIFRRPAKTVTEWPGQTVDFSGRQELFEAVGSTIEAGAAPWVNVSGRTPTGRIVTNRIAFKFRNSAGRVQSCEEHTAPHILIAMNRSNTNFSAHGFEGLSAALSGKSRRATMTLGMGVNGALPPHVIPHEFGHALGYLHEMAHVGWQNCAEAFDVKAWVKGAGQSFGAGFTKEQAEALATAHIKKLAERYRNLAVGTETFDRRSIMTYRIKEDFFDPAIMARNGATTCGIEETVTVLSADDKSLLLGFYGLVN